ncbi:MAG: SdrD B-like domain-containing protein, partial [Chloroflexota bacterium]
EIFDDLNGNGLNDPAEGLLDGVTVNLLDKNDQVVRTTQSVSGTAVFNSVPTGLKLITQVILPSSDHAFTKVNAQGNSQELIDSDVLRSNGRAVKFKFNQGGVVLEDLDAGIVRPGVFETTIWNDLNENGVRDNGEPLLDGVSVDLVDHTGTVVQTVLTASGIAIFDPVPANMLARVQVNLPTDAVFTARDQGSDESLDSDVNPNTGRVPLYNFKQSGLTIEVGAGIIFTTPPE